MDGHVVGWNPGVAHYEGSYLGSVRLSSFIL